MLKRIGSVFVVVLVSFVVAGIDTFRLSEPSLWLDHSGEESPLFLIIRPSGDEEVDLRVSGPVIIGLDLKESDASVVRLSGSDGAIFVIADMPLKGHGVFELDGFFVPGGAARDEIQSAMQGYRYYGSVLTPEDVYNVVDILTSDN